MLISPGQKDFVQFYQCFDGLSTGEYLISDGDIFLRIHFFEGFCGCHTAAPDAAGAKFEKQNINVWVNYISGMGMGAMHGA